MQLVKLSTAAFACMLTLLSTPTQNAKAFLFSNFQCDGDDKLTRETAAKYLLAMSEIYKGLSQLESKKTEAAQGQFAEAAKKLTSVKEAFENILKSTCFKTNLDLNYKVVLEGDVEFILLTFKHFKVALDPKEMIPAEKVGFPSLKTSVPQTLRIAVVAILQATGVVLDDLQTYQKMGAPQKTELAKRVVASTSYLTYYGLLVSRMAEKT